MFYHPQKMDLRYILLHIAMCYQYVPLLLGRVVFCFIPLVNRHYNFPSPELHSMDHVIWHNKGHDIEILILLFMQLNTVASGVSGT